MHTAQRSGLVMAGAALALVSRSSTKDKAAAALPMTLAFPSTAVPAGGEKTKCVVLRLGNTEKVRIGAIHNKLGVGSHHLIVYRVNDTAEKLTPFECEPLHGHAGRREGLHDHGRAEAGRLPKAAAGRGLLARGQPDDAPRNAPRESHRRGAGDRGDEQIHPHLRRRLS